MGGRRLSGNRRPRPPCHRPWCDDDSTERADLCMGRASTPAANARYARGRRLATTRCGRGTLSLAIIIAAIRTHAYQLCDDRRGLAGSNAFQPSPTVQLGTPSRRGTRTRDYRRWRMQNVQGLGPPFREQSAAGRLLGNGRLSLLLPYKIKRRPPGPKGVGSTRLRARRSPPATRPRSSMMLA